MRHQKQKFEYYSKYSSGVLRSTVEKKRKIAGESGETTDFNTTDHVLF
jgi:hypothetical protein